MHSLKTGALITGSVECGAMLTNQASEPELNALQCFSQHIGLAFQIHDDILDATGDSFTMGKQSGQDLKNGKCTFVTVLGLQAAEDFEKEHYKKGFEELRTFW